MLLGDTVLAYETLSRVLPRLLDSFGLTGFQLTARAKSEYSENRLVHPKDVTSEQRKRIYDAFAVTLEMTGLYQG